MCGLSGCVGYINAAEEACVRDMLRFGGARGDDSTGLGAVERDFKGGAKTTLVKRAGPFPFLMDTKGFTEIFHGFKCLYIGHNRSATVGNSTWRNAHPFEFDNVMGAHNGTIGYQDKNALADGATFGTDSEAILWNIEQFGVEATIGSIEADATNAWALVWFDARDRSINFLRNDKRPLVLTWGNDGKTIFWNSEYPLLAAALMRNKITVDDKKSVEVPVDEWWKFVIPPTGQEAFGEPEKKTVKAREKKNVYGTGYGGSGKGYYSQYNAAYDYTDDELPWLDKAEKTGAFAPLMFPRKKPEEKKPSESAQLVIDLNERRKQQIANKVMTPEDVSKKKALETVPEHADPEIKNRVSFFPQSNASLRVYRDNVSGSWILYIWDETTTAWVRTEHRTPPYSLPYTILNAESDHHFKHAGKKHKKVVYYRGYNGTNLAHDAFGLLMQRGCICCQRMPEWGNKVVFVNRRHDFLCEYCALDDNLKQSSLAVGQMIK